MLIEGNGRTYPIVTISNFGWREIAHDSDSEHDNVKEVLTREITVNVDKRPVN